MKSSYKLLFLTAILLLTNPIHAQVTIGANTAPDADAILDLQSQTKKGLLLPRVALIATNDFSPLNKHVEGMVVYNTATTTGTNGVSPGYYYNNGSKWLRIANSSEVDVTKDAWVNDPTNSMIKLGSKSDDVTARTTGTDVVVTDDGKVGIGNVAPNARLDVRTNTTSTTDPGDGYIGIGTTTSTASSAGSGAIRYSTLSGGVLEYSNGTAWNTLSSSNLQRSIVVARKTTTLIVAATTLTYVQDWSTTDLVDVNGNFAASTGTFTAPRTGVYMVSFTFAFASANITGGQVEAQLICTSSSDTKKSISTFPAGGTSESGASISFAIQLNAGETVRPAIYQNTGSAKTLKVPSGTTDVGYVNFSVVEL